MSSFDPSRPFMPRTRLGRVLGLFYGLVAYVAFLGVFLYAVAFAAGLWVPKSINDGSVVSLASTFLVNGSLLGLFAVQHTIMARPAFKRWWTRIIPASAERSTFVLVTSICLGLMFWQWRPLPTLVWDVEPTAARWLLHGLCVGGWAIVLASTFLIDHFALFGLRPSWDAFRGRDPVSSQFVTRGFYRWVRHPLMTGFLIAFWATPSMSQGHLLFAVGVTGYVLFGTRVEERDLLREHGDTYRSYQRSVPGLLPWRGRAA